MCCKFLTGHNCIEHGLNTFHKPALPFGFQNQVSEPMSPDHIIGVAYLKEIFLKTISPTTKAARKKNTAPADTIISWRLGEYE